MADTSMITKVYVKLNKKRIFNEIETDLGIVKYWEENKGRVSGIMTLVGVVIGMLLCWIFQTKLDWSWKMSVVVSITIGLCVIGIEHFFYFVFRAAFMSHGPYDYTDEFQEVWERDSSYMSRCDDVLEVYKWLVNLPNAINVVKNANYIKTVLNNNFLCWTDGEDGEIWDKDTGEKYGFCLDGVMLEVKFKKVDDEDLILIVTEEYHYLMDTETYENTGACLVLDESEDEDKD